MPRSTKSSKSSVHAIITKEAPSISALAEEVGRPIILVAADETEITTTSTSYPSSDQKYFLFCNTFSYVTMRVAVEGKISTSGQTLYVGIFKGGTQVGELSFTGTRYVVKNINISISDVPSTSSVQIGIRMKVTGGTGYVRMVEFYTIP